MCTTKLAQIRRNTTLYCKACTHYILLCTTKIAQSTSRYYFVSQTLHKSFPSTTLTTTIAKYSPILLWTTKLAQVLLCTRLLAQSTSQYYCVLQSLHKQLPSTTLYYKACTKYFPVLLCTTKLGQTLPSTTLYYKVKLAESTSQYYFVLQSWHKESFYTQHAF